MALNWSARSTHHKILLWLVGAFNQKNALVGAFSVIVQPVVEPMEHYTALVGTAGDL